MRLLRTQGDELELVSINVNDDSVKYAILSHRWLADEEEVTFDDIINKRGQHKKGWEKLIACRKQALQDGFEYVWIDTCCVDKRSSQELTESLNAMFRWYRDSAVCYAYLSDVSDPVADLKDLESIKENQVSDPAVTVTEPDSGENIDAEQPSSSLPEPIITEKPTGVEVVAEASTSIEAADDDDKKKSSTSSPEPAVGEPPADSDAADVEQKAQPSIEEKSIYIPVKYRKVHGHFTGPSGIIDLRDFAASCWFERGWTLQEMLAPKKVQFFSKSWMLIADLRQLVDVITEVTGIHREVLAKDRPIESYSVAQKFCWAARRKVKQIEDRAYSLLGLLDVNIPVIYGEGHRAFLRLQEELLRTSADDSIFAYDPYYDTEGIAEDTTDEEVPLSFTRSLLATSPAAFRHSRDIVQPVETARIQYQVVSKDINFTTLVADDHRDEPREADWEGLRYSLSWWQPRPATLHRSALLGCSINGDPTRRVALHLIRSGQGSNRYTVRQRFGDSHCEIIDIFNARRGEPTTWRRASFTVARQQDMQSHKVDQVGAVVAVRKIDPQLVVRPGADVKELLRKPMSGALQFFMDKTKPRTSFVLEVSLPGQVPAELEVIRNREVGLAFASLRGHLFLVRFKTSSYPRGTFADETLGWPWGVALRRFGNQVVMARCRTLPSAFQDAETVAVELQCVHPFKAFWCCVPGFILMPIAVTYWMVFVLFVLLMLAFFIILLLSPTLAAGICYVWFWLHAGPPGHKNKFTGTTFFVLMIILFIGGFVNFLIIGITITLWDKRTKAFPRRPIWEIARQQIAT